MLHFIDCPFSLWIYTAWKLAKKMHKEDYCSSKLTPVFSDVCFPTMSLKVEVCFEGGCLT